MSTACDESSRSFESLHRRWAILSLGSFQSGQMELTVNQLSEDFGGSNPSLPTDCLTTLPVWRRGSAQSW